jgi:predicted amidohydrolase
VTAMSAWKIAAVQMDCALADVAGNLAAIRRLLNQAVGEGAKLVIFPECALSGYCFTSREEGWKAAVPVPGPEMNAIAADCSALGCHAVVGLLERGPADALFNSCALVGPSGLVACYRKLHLPFLGVDRFTTPGDRPFVVHDLGGLRIGMNICYDGSFPESSRVLMLLGADLVVLPTNWPMTAKGVCEMCHVRAMENHIFYAAVNRVGEERGFRFKGQSRIIAPSGESLAEAGEGPALLYAEIDPTVARNKRVVRIPGQHEMDRVKDRRPEMYGPIVLELQPARQER